MAATLELCVAYGDTPTAVAVGDLGLRFGMDDRPDPLASVIRPPAPGDFPTVLVTGEIAVLRARGTLLARVVGDGWSAPTGQTAYSAPKTLFLRGTTSSRTSVANRRVRLTSDLPDGVMILVQGATSYAAAGSLSNPLIVTYELGEDAIPTGWIRLTTDAATIWDTTEAPLVAGERNGDYLRAVLAISSRYDGGANSLASLRDLEFHWDER